MDEIYMIEALKEAKKAYKYGDIPVGAVIVYDNKIIARAFNKKEKTNSAIDHAEIIAIKKACKYLNNWRLTGCSIYVTLEPCTMCKGAIDQARMSKLVYGTKNEKSDNICVTNTYGGVLSTKCKQMLENFFKKLRK